MTNPAAIFVVDDDPHCRESMCALLSAKGYAATGFRSAEEFLESPASHARSGCLITDYRMSGMTGLELQRKLAERQSLLPVIVVSGHANVKIAVQVMSLGAVTLLEKPHAESELMAAIGQALRQAERTREQREQRAEIREAWERLSPESQEVARMLADGCANKVIAGKQHMGLRTVERRRRELLQHMGVQTVPQLAKLLVILEGYPTPRVASA